MVGFSTTISTRFRAYSSSPNSPTVHYANELDFVAKSPFIGKTLVFSSPIVTKP